MRTIRIDDEVWQALQSQAEPFADTPNSVLRRVLGLDPWSTVVQGEAMPEPSEEEHSPDEENNMNFRRLMHFLNHTMVMREIYQPWLIRHLVVHSGESSVAKVADTIPIPEGSPASKRHLTPISVLTKHGIIAADAAGKVKLNTWPLSQAERTEVVNCCERLIQEFDKRRGS